MSFNQKYNYQPGITITNKYLNTAQSYLKDIEVNLKKDNIYKSNDKELIQLIKLLGENKYKEIEEIYRKKEYSNNVLFEFIYAYVKSEMITYINQQKQNQKTILGLNNKTKEKKKITKIDYSEPISIYTSCIRKDPSFIYAYFNRANSYARSREIEKAISDYTKVISLDGNFAEAFYNRGLLYIYKGEIAKAAQDLSKAGEFGLKSSYNILNRYCRLDK
jgi:tetratricopeptide (TPR) repeat protein